MKKLLFIIPSVLLLLAAGTLVFCNKRQNLQNNIA